MASPSSLGSAAYSTGGAPAPKARSRRVGGADFAPPPAPGLGSGGVDSISTSRRARASEQAAYHVELRADGGERPIVELAAAIVDQPPAGRLRQLARRARHRLVARRGVGRACYIEGESDAVLARRRMEALVAKRLPGRHA